MSLSIIETSPLLQRLLGLAPEAARKIDRMHLAFAATWPQVVLSSLLLFALLWFSFFYYRDGRRPSWLVKGPLVLLRMLALCALLMMLAQPVLRLTHADSVRPSVVLMVDTSDSMSHPDARLPGARVTVESEATGVDPGRVAGLSRLDRVNLTLNHSRVVQELAKRFSVRAYSFAGKSRAIAIPGESSKLSRYQFSLAPDPQAADSTRLGDALHRPLDELAGQPVAGAMVLSDGESNLGDDPLLVADTARQFGLKVSTTGFGDPTKTKDVALISVLADDVVRVNNTVTVYAALSQRGYAGKTVSVVLQRGGEVIGRESLRFGPDDQKQEVHFNYVPSQGGRFAYTVSVAPQPGEITLTNNKRSFLQSVISKKLKALYVEGEPRYEFRYLKNAILRDTSLDFACLLLSGDDLNSGGEGNLKVRGFPATEKELFEYDIVVLGDVPRSYFSDTQLQALRRFVEDRGASMLIIAGEQHMPHEYAGTPLEAVMPVVISPSPDPVITDEPFLWQLTTEGKHSPVMQLEDTEAENERTWAEDLPGMFWVAGTQRVKPGAVALAVHPTRRNADGPYPLVATQAFGAGKCYMELVDSTWKWRWKVGDRYFYRYWGQVFRTLTPKELPGNSRYVQLNADRSNYLLGDRVQLNARLLDAYYHPIKVPSATATIRNENGQTQQLVLQSAPGSPGLYTTSLQPDRLGKFEISLTSPANPEAKATAAFLVETQALERQKPELDEVALKRIAAAGGGKYYPPTDLLKWAKGLPDHPLVIRSEQEIELWNAPLLLLLFLTPLTLEWLVRKRSGLL